MKRTEGHPVCPHREPLIGVQCSKGNGHEGPHSDRPGRIWYPSPDTDSEERCTEVEYFVQCQQPDGTWEQCSSSSADADYIARQRAAHQRRLPECQFRIARRTTRVIVDVERSGAPE